MAKYCNLLVLIYSPEICIQIAVKDNIPVFKCFIHKTNDTPAVELATFWALHIFFSLQFFTSCTNLTSIIAAQFLLFLVS